MSEVKVRQAEVTVRTVKLSKALLKQVSQIRSVPKGALQEGTSLLNPEYVVGWIHGSVLGDEFGRYVLFQKDGDLYLLNWPGFKQEGIKQIYV